MATDPNQKFYRRRQQWVDQIRPMWHEVIRPFDPSVETFFPCTSELPQRHLQNARIVENREYMIANCLPKGGVVVEVGTQTGYFAERILDLVQPEKLHVIDIDYSSFDRHRFEGRWDLLEIHEGNSAEVLAGFDDEHFDWIYIDADHSYEGVVHDIEQARRKVKRDGLLVFNDYTYWSPMELAFYGVVQAVNQLCIEDGWEILYLALQNRGYYDVALRRIADAR